MNGRINESVRILSAFVVSDYGRFNCNDSLRLNRSAGVAQ